MGEDNDHPPESEGGRHLTGQGGTLYGDKEGDKDDALLSCGENIMCPITATQEQRENPQKPPFQGPNGQTDPKWKGLPWNLP